MKTPQAGTPGGYEQVLLGKIHRRLLVWVFAAFLLFEALLGVGIYEAARGQLNQTAYAILRAEWAQKNPELIASLKDANKSVRERSSVDRTAEVVATWVVTAEGQIVRQDLTLVNVPRTVLPLFRRLVAKTGTPGRKVSWIRESVAGVPVLVGIEPIWQGTHYLGMVLSAYSLATVNNTLRLLRHIEGLIGAVGILAIVPLSAVLTWRSLQPVKRALERQRAFVNDAAHELRTPLTILHANLELAADDPDPAAVGESIREGLRETDYLSRLVEDLSLLARIDSGVLPFVASPVNVAEVASEVLSAMEPLAARRSIALSCHGCDEPVVIAGEAVRLRQLLMILLDNAMKYNRDGGTVQVFVQALRQQVEIRVADSGLGIAPAELPHVFQRFYRARGASLKATGSGLGLSIAAAIVRMHRGQIEMESQPGAGTTVVVRLPRQADA